MIHTFGGGIETVVGRFEQSDDNFGDSYSFPLFMILRQSNQPSSGHTKAVSV